MHLHITEPFLLKQLMEWERKIADQVPDLERPTGYFLGIVGDGSGGYACSPVDSVKFAGTGMDGIHYAFLTDFGLIDNLDEAPVICVSPMDFGNCVRLVARSLKDFFRLKFSGCELLLLNEFTTREHYEEALKEEDAENSPWMNQRRRVAEMALIEFGLERIPDAYGYIQQIRAERNSQMVLQTTDGLGIVSAARTVGVSHPWVGQAIPYHDEEAILSFLSSASRESKLALVRDYQEQWITDPRSLQFLVDELQNMGLHVEANRLGNAMLE